MSVAIIDLRFAMQKSMIRYMNVCGRASAVMNARMAMTPVIKPVPIVNITNLLITPSPRLEPHRCLLKRRIRETAIAESVKRTMTFIALS